MHRENRPPPSSNQHQSSRLAPARQISKYRSAYETVSDLTVLKHPPKWSRSAHPSMLPSTKLLVLKKRNLTSRSGRNKKGRGHVKPVNSRLTYEPGYILRHSIAMHKNHRLIDGSDPLLELLSMHPQGQGDKEIHHPQHGRVCCYPYVINPLRPGNSGGLAKRNYTDRPRAGCTNIY